MAGPYNNFEGLAPPLPHPPQARDNHGIQPWVRTINCIWSNPKLLYSCPKKNPSVCTLLYLLQALKQNPK